MAYLYCTAHKWTPNTGFITHKEKAKGFMQEYFNNVYVVSDQHREWMAKVVATEKTKAEAQALVDAYVTAEQAVWDALPDDEKDPIVPTNKRLVTEEFVLP
tara:strand:- start:7437 stop:7739 length:303 start_codon:yes stop_codon:yes gene_type:complete